MPDINSVTVTFGNGIKREEYGPLKKAEVSITAAVAPNEDGSAVLDQISFIAQNKVRAMLSIAGAEQPPSAAPAASPAPVDEAASAGEAPKVVIVDTLAAGLEPPPKRTRRTKAEMEAARAAENTTKPAETGDEWDEATPIKVTDAELTDACAKTAERLGEGGPAKVREAKEIFNPKPGNPFTVKEIAQENRKAFLEKLAAL